MIQQGDLVHKGYPSRESLLNVSRFPSLLVPCILVAFVHQVEICLVLCHVLYAVCRSLQLHNCGESSLNEYSTTLHQIALVLASQLRQTSELSRNTLLLP